MKWGSFSEGDIAEKRAHVHHFLLAASLEERNESIGEEDKPENIDLELRLRTELAIVYPRIRRQTQTWSSHSWIVDFEIPAFGSAPVPFMTPALLHKH